MKSEKHYSIKKGKYNVKFFYMCRRRSVFSQTRPAKAGFFLSTVCPRGDSDGKRDGCRMFKVFRVCVPFYDSDGKRGGCWIFYLMLDNVAPGVIY
jgi:hypothetical protein